MKTHDNKNIMYLVLAAFVLLAANAWVWMGIWNGQLSSAGNPLLSGTFMVLNMISLLWAVSLLGLQPLVVACSYVAGGVLAYRGGLGMVGISMAEVTTAGATYGAIGALAVGNFTTKVRLAFYQKGQVPFIFVIVGLLLVDGILNSQISGAGWGVVLNVLVLPFVFAGGIIGLAWTMVLRFGMVQKIHIGEMPAVEVLSLEEVRGNGATHLVIQAPDTVAVKDRPKKIAAKVPPSNPKLVRAKPLPVAKPVRAKPLPVDKPVRAKPLPVAKPVVEPVIEKAMLEEEPPMEHFFPLEIDKDDEFVLPRDEAGLMEAAPLKERLAPIPEPVPEPKAPPKPIPEPVSADLEPEKKKSSEDWLSGHLDLLNKISNDD